MVKLNTCFLFGYKEIIVILLVCWVNFAFNWIWGTFLYSKSSFKLFLTIPYILKKKHYNKYVHTK